MLHFNLLGPANETALLITVRCGSAVGHSNASMHTLSTIYRGSHAPSGAKYLSFSF